MKKQPAQRPMTLAAVRAELLDVARIAQAFVDGDLCRAMLRPHAERFMVGDDFDMNPDVCVPLKKTLIRLERLSRVPCATTIWRRRPEPEMQNRAEPILYGVAPSPATPVKIQGKGYQPPVMDAPLKTAFLRGRLAFAETDALSVLRQRHVVQRVSGAKECQTLRLLVPIRDSMGDVTAVLEIFTLLEGR